MSHLSPTTLTQAEQKLILRATARHPRDHVIISMALGTGLRLGELVGLNVGGVYAPDGSPKVRVRIRREIAKRGRTGDAFIPDRLVPKLARYWKWKQGRGERLDLTAPLDRRVPADPRLVPGSTLRPSRLPLDDDGLHAPVRRRDVRLVAGSC